MTGFRVPRRVKVAIVAGITGFAASALIAAFYQDRSMWSAVGLGLVAGITVWTVVHVWEQ